MRSIVAFLVASIAAAAQAPEIARLEKRIAGQPNNIADRQSLLRALSFQGSVPVEKARAGRRTLILWLIEHQSSSKIFDEPFMQLWPRGRLGDPDGYRQAARLWMEQAAAPGASMKTIANAAIFFKIPDASEGLAILDAAGRDHPHDPDLARARGVIDAALILGISGLNDAALPRYTTNAAARDTPAAANALQEVDSSQDANLVGSAGEFLSRTSYEIPPNVTFGDDDALALAEKWLRRARELAPASGEWNVPLANTIRRTAFRINDPAGKLRQLNESSSLLPEGAKHSLLPSIAQAEFEAGDDAAAERDARALTEKPQSFADYYIGQMVLGLLAFAHGDVAEAKERLLASVKPPPSFKNPTIQPNMMLAQDIFDSGDRDTVVAFLEALRPLWPFDQGHLDHMVNFVKRGAAPLDLMQMTIELLGLDFRNRIAPDFEIKDGGGKLWTRDQLSGKVVALVFGTGPSVEKLTKDFSPRGVEFFHASASREDPLARRFEIESDPTLIVLDRKGLVISYLPGKSNETAWQREIERGISGQAFGNQGTVGVPQPKDSVINGSRATLSWGEADNAESYVVEWDSRDEKGWIFDREGTVRVIPTRNTSAILDLTGFSRIRWRVYAVPRVGRGGSPSGWRELEGVPVTKIYK